MTSASNSRVDAALRRTHSNDIDHHIEQLQDWRLQYDQLDCGAFEGAFTDVRCHTLQLFVESTALRVRQRGQLAPGTCCFGLLAQARGEDDVVHLNGVRTGWRDLVVIGEASTLDLCTPPQCTTAGLIVQAKAFTETADVLGTLPWLRGESAHVVALTPPELALSTWRKLLLFAVQSVCARPEMLDSAESRRLLHDELLTQLIDLLGGGRESARVLRADARKRMVDKACELLLFHTATPLSMLDVCREVGASPRKLGYCFQEVLGLSPARLIKVTRLNAVRRELAHGANNRSVYDVAARWGFWHFGHFSNDYKQQFGELASQTLRRSTSA